MSNTNEDIIMCSVSAVLFAPCPFRCHDTSAKGYKITLPARSKQDTFPHSDIKTSNKMWHVAFLFFSTKISSRECDVAWSLLSFLKTTPLNTCLGIKALYKYIHGKIERQNIQPFQYHKSLWALNACACLPSSIQNRRRTSWGRAASPLRLKATSSY